MTSTLPVQQCGGHSARGNSAYLLMSRDVIWTVYRYFALRYNETLLWLQIAIDTVHSSVSEKFPILKNFVQNWNFERTTVCRLMEKCNFPVFQDSDHHHNYCRLATTTTTTTTLWPLQPLQPTTTTTLWPLQPLQPTTTTTTTYLGSKTCRVVWNIFISSGCVGPVGRYFFISAVRYCAFKADSPCTTNNYYSCYNYNHYYNNNNYYYNYVCVYTVISFLTYWKNDVSLNAE